MKGRVSQPRDPDSEREQVEARRMKLAEHGPGAALPNSSKQGRYQRR